MLWVLTEQGRSYCHWARSWARSCPPVLRVHSSLSMPIPVLLPWLLELLHSDLPIPLPMSPYGHWSLLIHSFMDGYLGHFRVQLLQRKLCEQLSTYLWAARCFLFSCLGVQQLDPRTRPHGSLGNHQNGSQSELNIISHPTSLWVPVLTFVPPWNTASPLDLGCDQFEFNRGPAIFTNFCEWQQ